MRASIFPPTRKRRARRRADRLALVTMRRAGAGRASFWPRPSANPISRWRHEPAPERSAGPIATPFGQTRCGCLTPCRSRCWQLDAAGCIREVNIAAEHFFDMGRAIAVALAPRRLLPFGSPVLRTRRGSDRRPGADQRLQARHLARRAPGLGRDWSTLSSRRCRERRRRDRSCCKNDQLPKKWTGSSPIAARRDR